MRENTEIDTTLECFLSYATVVTQFYRSYELTLTHYNHERKIAATTTITATTTTADNYNKGKRNGKRRKKTKHHRNRYRKFK